MRKVFIILVAVFLVLTAATAFAEKFDPYNKDYSVSIQGERTYFGSSDFKDFWDLQSSYDGYGISVERKLGSYVGIELSGGMGHYHKTADGIINSLDSSTTDINTYHFSISPKFYARTGKRTVLYFGGGPDYYHVELDQRYKENVFSGHYNEKFKVLGLHAFAGVEFMLLQNPGAKGSFDAPMSMFIEYRYSRVMIKEADKDFIKQINANFGTSEDAHDFDMGGNAGIIGLRWRF